MKRLSEKEKAQVISLMKDGKSLNHISKLTGRNKSTLYYHYEKLLGKKFKKVNLPTDEEFIGELMGLFAGDSNLHYDKIGGRHVVRFYFNFQEKSYVDELTNLFSAHFLKDPYKSREKNVLVVRYYSKELFNFIKEYVGWGISLDRRGANQKSRTVYLKGSNYSDNFKIGFLRGFIDSDGYLTDKKILFGSASGKIMRQVSRFLSDLGFQNFKLSYYERNDETRVGIWHLYVHKVERDKFLSLIKPRNLVKLNEEK